MKVNLPERHSKKIDKKTAKILSRRKLADLSKDIIVELPCKEFDSLLKGLKTNGIPVWGDFGVVLVKRGKLLSCSL